MSSPVARVTRLLALHCTILVAACGSGGGNQSCTQDSDCDSHFCKADGTCGPAATDGGNPDSGSGSGSGSNSELCTPNHDGSITTDEVPLAAGKMANFRVATDATWATAGTAAANNTRTWNLTGALANDSDGPTTLTGPTTEWWVGDDGFATTSYYTKLTASSDLLGVFHRDAAGITLLGVVSPTKTTGTYTEITYDPPATILKIPFKAGDTWTSSSNVVGYYSGAYVNYTEKYTSNVDQTGTMTTPYGDFPVLRVGTVLQQQQVGVGTYNTVRSYAWMAECFGTVAKVASQNNESNAEFSDDAEVTRIIP